MTPTAPPAPETPRYPAVTPLPRSTPHDPLTGALAREGFDPALREAVRRAGERGAPVSLLMVDLDHFKSINDAFGHARGDRVLREFARRVELAVRESDRLFRFGGDEFVLILPKAAKAEALEVGKRVLEAVRSTPFPGDPPLSISPSIGAATFPEDAPSADALFEAADRRLYRVKRGGRAHVAAEDRETLVAEPLFPDSRMLERDEGVEAIYRFLNALPAATRGVLEVHGERGAGRSRFLAEAESAALLLGYSVAGLAGTPALQGRSYGTLMESRPAWRESPPGTVAEAAHRLRMEAVEAGRAGLLLLVDEIALLDDATLEVVHELLRGAPGPSIAVAYAVERGVAHGALPSAPLRERVHLSPLTAEGLRSWMRSLLRDEPHEEFLRWLAKESGGLPGRVRDVVGELVRRSVLIRRGDRWEVSGSLDEVSLSERTPAPRPYGPAGLPTVLTSLVGRDREIQEVREMLARGRLVTLGGPGGVGKTRLALQIAAETAGAFRDGARFVALAPVVGPEGLATAIADALGLSFHGGTDPLQHLQDYLAEREMLLVLDNFEHLTAAAGTVLELLGNAPGLRVLVTSRERLALRGEELFEVSAMTFPGPGEDVELERYTAVQLFVQHARRHQYGFALTEEDRPHVARLCRALEGLPLALEIAAALVRVLSCRDIAEEVERDLDALSQVMPLRDMPDRHRSLRTVFEYSWGMLSPDEREALGRVSVFPGRFRRDAAERVAGASLYLLSSLVNKSLLRKAPNGDFEIHETVRFYAHEHLDSIPGERERVEELRGAFYADFVRARVERLRGRTLAAALREIGEELENLRVGWRWAIENERSEETEAYLQGLFRFLDVAGRFREGEALFRWGVRHARDERLRARLAARRGHFQMRLSRLRSAQRLARRSLAVLRRVGQPEDRLLPDRVLTTLHLHRGEFAKAERLGRRAARMHRRHGDRLGLAHVLCDLGMAIFLQGRTEESSRLVRHSLRIHREIGNLPGMARCHTNLGQLEDQEGRLDEASRHFRRSLELSRELGDPRSVADALNNLGVLTRRLAGADGATGRLAEAARFVQESLRGYREIGSRAGIGLATYNLGDIALAEGRHPDARTLLLRALRIAHEIGNGSLVVSSLIGIGELLTRTGETERAVEVTGAALRHEGVDEYDRERAARLLGELGTESAPDVDPKGVVDRLLAEESEHRDRRRERAATHTAAPGLRGATAWSER